MSDRTCDYCGADIPSYSRSLLCPLHENRKRRGSDMDAPVQQRQHFLTEITGKTALCAVCGWTDVLWQKSRTTTLYASCREAKRNWRVLRDFGITIVEYREFFRVAEGRCEICRTADTRMVLDHNHTTGKVRGVLCDSCNVGLGKLRDNIYIVRNALTYLSQRD